MPISTLQAAQKVLELSQWNMTDLKLQKLLYLANMIHLGRHNTPLVDENFEAWMYGPVIPSLYRLLKKFGSNPITINVGSVENMKCEECKTLEDVWKSLGEKEGWELVDLTHKFNGAWNKNYDPARTAIISHEDILDEYNATCR